MKCCGRSEDECAALLIDMTPVQTKQAPRALPLLALGFLALGHALTLMSHCAVDKPATCVPELKQIPFIRPYIYQSLRLQKWATLISGFGCYLLLVLFSLAPSEERDFTRTGLQTEASVLVSAYLLLSLAHCYASTRLQDCAQGLEVVSQPSHWRSVRRWVAGCVGLFALAYFSLAAVQSPLLQTARRTAGHCTMMCSFMFVATYQRDLDSIEVSLVYQRRDASFKQLNRVTL